MVCLSLSCDLGKEKDARTGAPRGPAGFQKGRGLPGIRERSASLKGRGCRTSTPDQSLKLEEVWEAGGSWPASPPTRVMGPATCRGSEPGMLGSQSQGGALGRGKGRGGKVCWLQEGSHGRHPDPCPVSSPPTAFTLPPFLPLSLSLHCQPHFPSSPSAFLFSSVPFFSPFSFIACSLHGSCLPTLGLWRGEEQLCAGQPGGLPGGG